GWPIRTVDLDANYEYNQGKMTSVSYPAYWDTTYIPQMMAGPAFAYSYDSMDRPEKLTGSLDWVKDVLYNAAGQMTQMLTFTGSSFRTETRSYNTRGQLTQIANSPGGTIQYLYSASNNNGRITQRIGAGETVNYSYDSLNRLTLAETTGTQWGLSFTYDGFGNRLNQAVTKGSAPTVSMNYDAATNRINGWNYDANGNATVGPLGPSTQLIYDADNRLSQAGQEYYAYTPSNKRIWIKKPNFAEEVHFYSITGQRLGVYRPIFDSGTLRMTRLETMVYFGSRQVARMNAANVLVESPAPDRLESHVGTFPYGEEKGSATANDRVKFATYYRDSTGLDYA
ncbi:MAG: hypothetical protein ACREBC_38895, partial [Pyrinomonadaceae bacterium]